MVGAKRERGGSESTSQVWFTNGSHIEGVGGTGWEREGVTRRHGFVPIEGFTWGEFTLTD